MKRGLRFKALSPDVEEASVVTEGRRARSAGRKVVP
jgi:hypothetical protein